jgi:hypothetical protein
MAATNQLLQKTQKGRTSQPLERQHSESYLITTHGSIQILPTHPWQIRCSRTIAPSKENTSNGPAATKPGRWPLAKRWETGNTTSGRDGNWQHNFEAGLMNTTIRRHNKSQCSLSKPIIGPCSAGQPHNVLSERESLPCHKSGPMPAGGTSAAAKKLTADPNSQLGLKATCQWQAHELSAGHMPMAGHTHVVCSHMRSEQALVIGHGMYGLTHPRHITPATSQDCLTTEARRKARQCPANAQQIPNSTRISLKTTGRRFLH